ncbi:MAG: YdbL family protein [Nitrospirota bacterium]|nr:YdbL family protein [Nitrospirota bacterium]
MKQRCVLSLRLMLVAMIGVTIGTASVVLALSLTEAKDRGLVGEQLNGYLGIVGSSQTPDVQALVNDINRQRREKYQEIAARNETNVQAVELLAGKTAISKTRSGHYVQISSENWVKK